MSERCRSVTAPRRPRKSTASTPARRRATVHPIATAAMLAHLAAAELERILDEVDLRRPKPARLVELVAIVAAAQRALVACPARLLPADALHTAHSLAFMFGQWAPVAPVVSLAAARRARRSA